MLFCYPFIFLDFIRIAGRLSENWCHSVVLQESKLIHIRLNTAVLLVALLGVGFNPVSPVLAAEAGKAGASSVKQKAKVAAPKAKASAKSAPVALKKTSAEPVARKRASLSAAKKKIVSVPGSSPVPAWHEARRLDVQSAAALVLDQNAGDALYQKNASQVVPIASITKLMTAMVVLDSSPNLAAPITITDEDVDLLRGSRSRLHVGSTMSRENALLLALMSSENRAAHALARHYPGGMPAFLSAMNIKAQALGMRDTHFEDPTGLTSNNVSTAHDLAKMVIAAHRYPLIREFSTTSEATVDIGGRELAYRNTNPLVKSAAWDVGLSKTGYINEAGKCLVMQARLVDKPVVIVLLDSVGKQTRVGDANRIKRWLESTQGHAQAALKGGSHAVVASATTPAG
jgi:D-alanyl-D-alanine endopeptidase (penicillin-binding protein 7)